MPAKHNDYFRPGATTRSNTTAVVACQVSKQTALSLMALVLSPPLPGTCPASLGWAAETAAAARWVFIELMPMAAQQLTHNRQVGPVGCRCT